MKINQKGFTLVELLIVVAIIGIIAAIAIPNLLDAIDRAKQRATLSDLRVWGTALNAYNIDKSQFPPIPVPPTDMNALIVTLVPFSINSLNPTDRWKNLFIYTTNINTSYTIASGGKNGSLDLDCTPTNWFLYDCDLRLVDGIFVASPS